MAKLFPVYRVLSFKGNRIFIYAADIASLEHIVGVGKKDGVDRFRSQHLAFVQVALKDERNERKFDI